MAGGKMAVRHLAPSRKNLYACGEAGASQPFREEATMKTWTAPKLIEICIGMEVTGYESAEGDTLH